MLVRHLPLTRGSVAQQTPRSNVNQPKNCVRYGSYKCSIPAFIVQRQAEAWAIEYTHKYETTLPTKRFNNFGPYAPAPERGTG